MVVLTPSRLGLPITDAPRGEGSDFWLFLDQPGTRKATWDARQI